MRRFSGEVGDMKSNHAGSRKPDEHKPAARRAWQGDSAGFTLVEILIAMTILAIGMLGIAGLTGTAMKSGGYARALTQATNAAQNRVEALLSIPYANLEVDGAERVDLQRACAGPAGPANRPVYACAPTNQLVVGVAPDTKSYTWRYTVTLIDLNGDGIANNTDGLKRIDVEVDWTEFLSLTSAISTKQVTVTTMRAR